MAGRTLYDRVRVAYGMDDDDDAGAPTRPVDSLDGPLTPGAVSYAGSRQGTSSYMASSYTTPSYTPAPFATDRAAKASANSVYVPFDPDDQSDDEAIITSAFERRNKMARTAAESGDSGSRTTGASKSGDSTGERSWNRKQEDSRRRWPRGPPHPTTPGSAHDGAPIGKAQSKAGPGSAGKGKALSATAPVFRPSPKSRQAGPASSSAGAAASLPLPRPLVEKPSAKGAGRMDIQRGTLYPGHRVSFCPWSIVKNYHAWFVGKQNSELIRPYFQMSAILSLQQWNFCFIHFQQAPKRESMKYVLLVPTLQFQNFLDRVNQTLSIQLSIPPGPNGDKFRVYFGGQKTPVPRFLGHARDEAAFAALIGGIPAPLAHDFSHLSNQAQTAYRKMGTQLLLTYDKNAQKKAKSEKAQRKRKCERQAWGKQIKRIQRYLGLREKANTAAGIAKGETPTSSLRSLDLAKLAPYSQENDTIFVAMDIESYEFDHRILTEIGFGILDTRDLVGVPPGLFCENWFSHIHARHFRIREHASMVNRRYLHGCENNFNFGKSEFVRLKDTLSIVRHILQPRLANGTARKVILVGHGVNSDINLVKHIGFVVRDDMFLEIVDTQDIHRHYRMRAQQAGLKAVLDDLEIEHSFLHNGGNDAVYTLQAMLAIVLKKRVDSIRRENERQQKSYAPDEEVVNQGWLTGGEMSDGGEPEDDSGDDSGDEAAAVETERSASNSTSQQKSATSMESPKASPAKTAKPPPAAAAPTADDSEDLISL